MRRAILIFCLAGAPLALAWVLLNSNGGPGAKTYRVDAVFDNARGLIPGQLVEIAGARVGKIDAVSLTPDFKARIHMTVDQRFAPFRADASCSIRPQGLIAENFVQCDPGGSGAAPLKGAGGNAPTVPVQRTTEPVNLTDLFAVWNVPTRQRLTVLISQLGLGTSARGGELNAILRRANPALGEARKVISQLEAQQGELAGALDDTSKLVGTLARDPNATTRLVTHAASVVARTSRHANDLSATVARLPGLLQQARPTLSALDTVIATGTPLLASLHRAAPALDALTRDLGPLADAAAPAMAKLGPVLVRGAGVLRESAPLTRLLRDYAGKSLPSARLAGSLLTNLRERGFSENLMRFFYNAAEASARFDGTSHILPSHIATSPCGLYATTPVEGCSANYTQTATARSVTRHHARHRRARTRHAAAAPQQAAAPGPPASAQAPAPAKPGLPKLPPLPTVPLLQQATQNVPPVDKSAEKVLGYLLG